MAILEFFEYPNASRPYAKVVITDLNQAKNLMKFLEFDALVALRAEKHGGILGTNYYNGYAIRSYDVLFEIQDLFDNRDPKWRTLFNEHRLY